MELQSVNVDWFEAATKYREYANAEKQQSGYLKQKEPLYKDLKKLYYQIKLGKKVIDIPQVISDGGQHPNGAPKLAIAEMDATVIYCRRYNDGRVIFHHKDGWHWKVRANDFELHHVLPIYNDKIHGSNSYDFQAPVPLVPPQFVPKQKMADLYILWEVDQWKPVAPVDPWLLKRITKTHCVVLNGWNLTPLERSVMNAHL